MIELLVVILIIAILFALLIPAVMYARESSRRANCANNLRQFGLAMNQYESVSKVYPQGLNGIGFSAHSMLLPFFEQASLYNTINFNIPKNQSDLATSFQGPNLTARSTRVNIFLCPSDNDHGIPGRTNYAVSSGYGIDPSIHVGIFSDRAGGTVQAPYIGAKDVTDGTSNTLAVSEWVFGIYPGRDPLGSVFSTPDFNDSKEFDEFVDTCLNLDPQTSKIAVASKSAGWLVGEYAETIMNSDLPINKHSCLNGDSVSNGAWTAASRHGNGVNALYADGHSGYLRSTISLRIWRALSTRGGGEILDGSSY